MNNPYEYAYKRLQGKVEWMAKSGATAERLAQWNGILRDLATGYNEMEKRVDRCETARLEAEMTARGLVTVNLKLRAILKLVPVQEGFVEELLKFPLGVLEAQVARMERESWSVESNKDAMICLSVLKNLNEQLESYRRIATDYRNCRHENAKLGEVLLGILELMRKQYPELENEFPKI